MLLFCQKVLFLTSFKSEGCNANGKDEGRRPFGDAVVQRLQQSHLGGGRAEPRLPELSGQEFAT